MNPLLWLRRPDYAFNRLQVLFWEKTHPKDPWMASPMVAILDDWLKENDFGIEFGSGRSTLWLAERIEQLISVEVHKGWYQAVLRQLREGGQDHKVDLRLHEPEPSWKEDLPNSPYVRAVDDVPDGTADFVLVDGWAREHCAVVGIKKLKPGGILVFDDIHAHAPLPPRRSARGKRPPLLRAAGEFHPPYFKTTMAGLEGWRYIWSGNGKQDTALFQKPISPNDLPRSPEELADPGQASGPSGP